MDTSPCWSFRNLFFSPSSNPHDGGFGCGSKSVDVDFHGVVMKGRAFADIVCDAWFEKFNQLRAYRIQLSTSSL
ncbi:hypothetical protein, partial [Pelagicoccus sp. SDUM812005]|uniref:hypothetical protein n=1 Tax=Pelagicoccus sp. SDUM812005 TaxID=3041257 RepID=UPI00280FAD48